MESAACIPGANFWGNMPNLKMQHPFFSGPIPPAGPRMVSFGSSTATCSTNTLGFRAQHRPHEKAGSSGTCAKRKASARAPQPAGPPAESAKKKTLYAPLCSKRLGIPRISRPERGWPGAFFGCSRDPFGRPPPLSPFFPLRLPRAGRPISGVSS